MDKQDELAACILPILHKKRYTSCATSELTAEVAAAVRSFMWSDEVMERAATAAWKSWGRLRSGPFNTLHLETRHKYKTLARASIRTALGGDGE